MQRSHPDIDERGARRSRFSWARKQSLFSGSYAPGSALKRSGNLIVFKPQVLSMEKTLKI